MNEIHKERLVQGKCPQIVPMGLPLQIVPGKSNKFFSIKHLNKEKSVNLFGQNGVCYFHLVYCQSKDKSVSS